VLLRKKKKKAWINLMKISQLMNSLTLFDRFQNLQIVDQDHLETEDFEDIKSSISTIINRAIICSFFCEIIESWLRFLHQTKTNTNSFF
jgi:hypothetical protein